MKIKQKIGFVSFIVAVLGVAFFAVSSVTAAPDPRISGYVTECMKQQGATQQQCETEGTNALNTCADNQDEPNAPSIESCMTDMTKREQTKNNACKDAPNKSACEQAVGNCLANNSDATKQQECVDKVDGADPSQVSGGTTGANGQISADGGECGGAKTVILSCNGQSGEQAIGSLLKQFVLLLSLGVGILATGAIIYGAILYSSARDSASQTQQAIGVIRNAVIGIILYIFMVAIVNWLVPGGVIT